MNPRELVKTTSLLKRQANRTSQAMRLRRYLVGASLLAASLQAPGADTNAVMTAEQMFEGGTNTYANWIEFSAGGFMTRGNSAQAQQLHQRKRGVFGGIEDFHYSTGIATNTTLSIDGRALFDEHDYKLGLNLQREQKGYVRFNFENFRTWYNGAGGYFPPTGTQYTLPDNSLSIDRGEFSFEAGLRMEKLPQATFNYTHRYRDGEKSSTVWGPVLANPADLAGQELRGLAPGFYDIDERSDIFKLDLTHKIKKTSLGLGVRYETGDLDNALKLNTRPGELAERKITDRQETSYDMVSAHAFTETWFKPNLMFSSGFLFANLDSDFSGNRIYGEDYDVGVRAEQPQRAGLHRPEWRCP